MSGCLGEEGQVREITKRPEEMGDNDISSIPTVAIISLVDTCVDTNQTVHFKYNSLLNVNYTTIKLFLFFCF